VTVERFIKSDSLAAKIIRYGFSGMLVAGSQFLSMFILIEFVGFSSLILENTANFISIEISLLFAFFLHTRFSWNHSFETNKIMIKGLLMFHGVTGISFAIRIILFAVLSNYGMDYRLNTLIGIFVAVLINFTGYDRLVFKKWENNDN
jgi:putative flippase GtrA